MNRSWADVRWALTAAIFARADCRWGPSLISTLASLKPSSSPRACITSSVEGSIYCSYISKSGNKQLRGNKSVSIPRPAQERDAKLATPAQAPIALARSSTADSSLRVYFAAAFKRREELCSYATELEADGIRVTSRWLGGSSKLQGDDLHHGDRGAHLAQMDLDDVRAADLCFAFTEPADAADRGRGGRHAELGIAIGLGRTVATVGPIEHVFHRLPEVSNYPDWNAAHAWVLSLLAPARNAA